MTVVKKLPATEVGPTVTHTTAEGKMYHISQNPVAPPAKRFTLWRVADGGYKKLAVASSPYELYELMK